MDTRNVIIIGSGPAGLTAAIYASRANLKPVVIEGPESGGQLTTTTDVENFPGHPDGIAGPELMDKMKNQAKRFGTEFLQNKVIEINVNDNPFQIICQDETKLFAKVIIISTGATARYLGLPGEKELIGKGVSACATCDGFFYKNKIVHVVGGGDSAIEEALFLTNFTEKVYMIHRRDELRASKAMQKKILVNPKIEILWNSVVQKLLSDENGLTGIVVKNLKNEKVETRETHGLFMGIGHSPNTKFLNGMIDLDELGFIKTKNEVETNISGIFACGDVQDSEYRQAITAAGSGCQAAIKAERFLASL